MTVTGTASRIIVVDDIGNDMVDLSDIRASGDAIGINITENDLKRLREKLNRSEKRLMQKEGLKSSRKERTGTLQFHMQLFTDWEIEVLIYLINRAYAGKLGYKVHAGMLPFFNKGAAKEAVNRVTNWTWVADGRDLGTITGRYTPTTKQMEIGVRTTVETFQEVAKAMERTSWNIERFTKVLNKGVPRRRV